MNIQIRSRRRRTAWLALAAALTLTAGGSAVVGTAGAAQAACALPGSISGVSPGSGTAAGGTQVTLTPGFGSYVSTGTSPACGVAAVYFGTVAASTSSFVFNSDGTMTVTSPAQAAGTVEISITTGSGFTLPPNPPADDYTYTVACTTTITGTYNGPLTVGAGQVVCASAGGSAQINGPVKVTSGGELALAGATISGPLTASGAGLLSVCGSTVTGPVRVSGSTGQVTFGDGAGCASDTINGPASFTSNTGGVTLAGNTVGGPLGCTGNTPAPADNSDPNTVSGPATGQCASPF